jgi:hypothetical protein
MQVLNYSIAAYVRIASTLCTSPTIVQQVVRDTLGHQCSNLKSIARRASVTHCCKLGLAQEMGSPPRIRQLGVSPPIVGVARGLANALEQVNLH